MLLILYITWSVYIYLVGSPPIYNTWSSLIMVWLTAIFLIFTIFPKSFDKIKRVKFKDLFEIEMKETIENSTQNNLISFSDFDNKIITGDKGDISNLKNIIRKIIIKPNRPLLLTVNLKNGHNITFPMLFTYLFVLNFLTPSIIVLFVSSEESDDDLIINKSNIIGIVQGNRVLDAFYKIFPDLYNLFSFFNKKTHNRFVNNRFLNTDYNLLKNKVEEMIREIDSEQPMYLNEKNIKQWFGEIDKRIIDFPLQNEEYKEIYNGLLNDEEYLIIYNKSNINAVVSLNEISKNISLKTLKKYIEKSR